MFDFIAFVDKMNRKKERTKPPHLKAFQIKFRYGGSYFEKLPSCKKVKKLKKVVDKSEKVGIIVRVENNNSGPLVKGLRHRLFTAVTRVRIPYGLWYVADVTLDEKKFKKVSKKC